MAFCHLFYISVKMHHKKDQNQVRVVKDGKENDTQYKQVTSFPQ